MKTIVKRILRLVKKSGHINYEVHFCLQEIDSRKIRWFTVKFQDLDKADIWIHKVISRFEKHKKYPLDIAILAIRRKRVKYPEIIDDYYFDNIIPEN